MAKGPKLSEREKGEIEAFKRAGKNKTWISKELGRSRKVIRNFLKDTKGYGSKKRKNYTKKLSERDMRKIGRLASNSTKSCNDIKRELELNASKTTVWRAIKVNPYIEHQKKNVAPRLKPFHIEARLAFGKDNMIRDWKLVSFFLSQSPNFAII